MDQILRNETIPIGIGNTSAHMIYRRHMSFISTADMVSCYIINEVNQDQDAECAFVSDNLSCHETVQIFNYLRFLVCVLRLPASNLGFIQMGLIMLCVIAILTAYMFVISRYFILPNIVHVAGYMHIPLYDFGATIIAVITATPDILQVFNDCNISKNSALFYANIMGRAFMTFTIGLSVVCLGKHSKIPGSDVTKQIIIALVVMAVSYTLILTKLEDAFQPGKTDALIDLRPFAFFLVAIYVARTTYVILTKRRKNRHSSVHSHFHHITGTNEKTNGFIQIWHALNPFRHMKLPRYAIAFFSPFWVMAALQVPVIDKRRHMLAWCKYLTCINTIVFPIMVIISTRGVMGSLFIVVCVLCLTLLLFTMLYTSVAEPPTHQGFFAVAGIIFGFYAYRIVEGEVETVVWQTFSYIFNAPRDIIMIIGYVLHNLLNLVIFTQELVILGLGNLACGLVIGLVLNEAFLMLPIITFQKCFDYQSLVIVSANTTTCFTFMMLGFVLTLFSFALTDYKLRGSQGIFLIIYYVIFYVVVVLSGFRIIHPYGGFHSSSTELRNEIVTWA